MVGAGSVVTDDIPANTLWYGNPARMHGYVTDEGIYATLAKARGYKSAVDTMVSEVKRFLGGAKAELSVVNGKAREEAEKLVERLKDELDVVGDVPVMSVSPVLAIHTGPGLLGIVANRADMV